MKTLHLREISEFDTEPVDTLLQLLIKERGSGHVTLSIENDTLLDECTPESPTKVMVKEVSDVGFYSQVVKRRGVSAFFNSQVFYMPSFGVVISEDGLLCKESFEEARWITPTKAMLPGVEVIKNQAKFTPPDDLKRLNSGICFMPLGALNNYGHYILDALPALEFFRTAIISSGLPILSPQLKNWQRRHLTLLGLDAAIVELEDDIVFVDRLFHLNTMNHFLHSPTRILTHVAERQLSAIQPSSLSHQLGKRIFLQRDDQVVRKFSKEKYFANLLEEFGFFSVRPEELAVDDQIALFANAEIVIGPTGAAFSNALYCSAGTLVIEIIPSFMRGDVWVRNICAIRQCHWLQFEIPSRLPAEISEAEGELRPQIGLEYDPDFDLRTLIERLRPLLSLNNTRLR